MSNRHWMANLSERNPRIIRLTSFFFQFTIGRITIFRQKEETKNRARNWVLAERLWEQECRRRRNVRLTSGSEIELFTVYPVEAHARDISGSVSVRRRKGKKNTRRSRRRVSIAIRRAGPSTTDPPRAYP